MEVVRAEVLGFCGGVKRAIILAEQEFRKNANRPKARLETIGDLIHNKREIARLEGLGLHSVDRVGDVSEGSTVLIRAHGAEKSDYEALRSRKVEILEGICPLVRDIRNKIIEYSEQGYFILLTGDAEHSEVRGLISFAGEGKVIESPAEAHEYDIPEEKEKVVLLSQSTWKRETFLQVAEIMRTKRADILVEDTVCQATLDRQEALRRLIEQVDAVVVIGGRHSANTQELFLIARESGLPVWYCADEEDVPPALGQYERIGLSAGASSPDWLIDKIEEKILMQADA
ncbi:4-hydroxy-3-methylbut-2-enyl diphosphate reductase [Candidatus Haliotispira prima]|uniref:4-hydroxy-3-methylbut-2-enyl diphosphate reductase n=1 Tax=Candidatus Haliotispira prima TaxID=3034016 RepID=A0ABY8MFW9_9SPIO|nr:4-hydroxy-3-methylbut-2-enyl diphosphate reductase [Candidatus Haliotispira prima]